MSFGIENTMNILIINQCFNTISFWVWKFYGLGFDWFIWTCTEM